MATVDTITDLAELGIAVGVASAAFGATKKALTKKKKNKGKDTKWF